MPVVDEKIKILEDRLRRLEVEKTSLETQLKAAYLEAQNPSANAVSLLTQIFSPQQKIALFMDLFRGRMDVCPKRWENYKSGKSGYSPACSNEWVRNKCYKPKIKCTDCVHQAFMSVTTDRIRKHLGGENDAGIKRNYTMGVYPLLPNDTCWFLAIDFDKANWQQDVMAFMKTCRKKQVPFSFERSRSGNGGHIWIFFKQPILASEARKMGSALLTETMENYPDIGFESYDRLFPNQDTLPSGGFGNLIACRYNVIHENKETAFF